MSSAVARPLAGRHQSCIACGAAALRALRGFRRVELVSCGSCGLVFSPCVPTEAELVEHYEGYERNVGAASSLSGRRREALLDRFATFRQTGRILDVGCGVGDLLSQARTRGWETYGTEYTDLAVEICRGNGHVMHQGPLDASHYQPASFDVIVYTEVVEHINNHRDEFAQVRDLLRPGGLLYVTTPNFGSLSRRLLGDRWNVIQYPEHLTYFTSRSLCALMRRLGFSLVSLRTTGVSISRIRASVRAAPEPISEPTRRSTREDEALRGLLERPLLGGVKFALNGFLSVSRLGDTIKAEFQRPRT